jgi:hypothetical protein
MILKEGSKSKDVAKVQLALIVAEFMTVKQV